MTDQYHRDEDRSKILAILEALIVKKDEAFKNDPGAERQYDRFCELSIISPCSYQVVEQLKSVKNGNTIVIGGKDDKSRVPLPPLPVRAGNIVLPFLAVYYLPQEKTTLRYGIDFYFTENEDLKASIGYRFEFPHDGKKEKEEKEEKEEESEMSRKHDYYHVQVDGVIHGMEDGHECIGSCTPTISIGEIGAVSLLLFALASFYGKGFSHAIAVHANASGYMDFLKRHF